MTEDIIESPPPEAPARKRLNPVAIAVLAVIIVFTGYKGYASLTFGWAHAVTDDAYVTGDLINISPTVPGTLVELNIKDGQFVRKGELIAKLDTSGPEADVAQAEANLRAMQTQVPQAEAAFEFAQMSTDAAIKASEAGIDSQSARTAGSRLQAEFTRDSVTSQIQEASSQLQTAEAQAKQALAGVDTARASVFAAAQGIVTAQHRAEAANGAVVAAQANADRTKKDLDRYAKLVAADAITRQQFDAATAAWTAAHATLASARQQEQASESEVIQARRMLAQLKTQVVVAQKQGETAQAQVRVAQAALTLAKTSQTNVQISQTNVQSSQGLSGEASAALSSAEAGSEQVNLRQHQISTAKAQVQQSKAMLDRAKIHLRDCNLVAPCDGYVVRRTVNVGTAINPGQTVATITRGSEVWVMANFKETEIGNVREGQPVEFDVDAFPNSKFRGKVIHILRATGSATTLLPPDNSTGNFTKVVQRVPIKISIQPLSSLDDDVLRQGMSVTAIIDTESRGGK